MRIPIRLKLAGPFMVGLAVLVFVAAPSPAGAAESPWWHVTAEPVPTYLHGGVGQSEVQELTATPGTFNIGGGTTFVGTLFTPAVGGVSLGFFANEPLAKEVTEFEKGAVKVTVATAGNLQIALEGEQFYGKGGVTVEESGTGGALKFVVTSTR